MFIYAVVESATREALSLHSTAAEAEESTNPNTFIAKVWVGYPPTCTSPTIH